MTNEPAMVACTCRILFAYDLGFAVDLQGGERLLADSRRERLIRRPRRAPASVGERVPPLRATLTLPGGTVGGLALAGTAEVSVYDFGGACLTYDLQFLGPVETMVALADALYDHADLLADSRARMTEVLEALGEAVTKPGVSELVEDYVIFELAPPEGGPDDLLREHASTIARALRAETGVLSAEEVAEALATRLSYRPGDVALIDWCAALLVGEDVSDERYLLELATVELVQLRRLDALLDVAVDDAYRVLTRKGGPSGALTLRFGTMRRLARMQVEFALLYGTLHHAMKLLGDQYLARMFSAAARRFHLPAWEAGIERKLETLDRIHEKLVGRATTLRLELMEWVIIVLIAVSIIVYFI